VLDVSHGTLLERDEATDGVELALVKEKLTLVHREFGVKAKGGWQEVA
jgi:two-component system chemotaxis sensor kinase CheA